MTLQPTAYDEVIYPESTYSQSHPNRLATVATLFGIDCAPVETCRYLDLGCGVGAQPIAFAYSAPNATAMGIDYAEAQIAIGRQTIDNLGLDNVRLEAMSFADVPEDIGQFDYISAHGIYSWIAPHLRDALLSLIKRHLAPNGIAYVSYNTKPGWMLFGLTRDIMRFRVKDISDPHERAMAARDLLERIKQTPFSDEEQSDWGRFFGVYDRLVKVVSDVLATKEEQVFLHDDLEVVMDAVYFHEFYDHIQGHGFEYLSDANFASNMGTNLPKSVQNNLQELSHNIVELEQYSDFFRNRTFRQSVLVHKEVPFTRKAKSERVIKLLATSSARQTESSPEEEKNGKERYGTMDNIFFTADDPMTKAAFHTLFDTFPTPISLVDLVTEARGRAYAHNIAPRSLEEDAELTAGNLLMGYARSNDLIELHAWRPPFTGEISEKPVVSALARYQILRGDGRVTNLKLERMEPNPTTRALIPLCDGEHTTEDLFNFLKKEAVRPPHAQDFDAKIEESLKESLHWMRNMGLLIG